MIRFRRPVSHAAVLLLLLGFSYGMSFFHRVCPSVLAKDLMEGFNMDAADFGLIGSATMIGYALTQVPSGILADIFGGRRTMAVYQGLAGLFCCLFTLCGSLSSALACRFLLGLSLAGNVPAYRILASSVPASRYALCCSVLTSFGPVGTFLASYPLVMLSSLTGWRPALLCAGVVSICMCVLLLVLVPDRDLESAAGTGGTGNRPSAREKVAALGRGVSQVVRMRNFWLVVVYFMCMGSNMFALVAAWWGSYLMDACGMTKAGAGLSLSIVSVFPLAGTITLSWASDRVFHSRKIPLVGAAVLHLLLLAWACFLRPLDLSFAAATMLGALLIVSSASIGPICYTILKESVPGSALGSASGVVNASAPVLTSLVQPVVGLLVGLRMTAGATGTQAYAAGFLPLLFCAAAAVLTSFLIRDTLDRKQ